MWVFSSFSLHHLFQGATGHTNSDAIRRVGSRWEKRSDSLEWDLHFSEGEANEIRHWVSLLLKASASVSRLAASMSDVYPLKALRSPKFCTIANASSHWP